MTAFRMCSNFLRFLSVFALTTGFLIVGSSIDQGVADPETESLDPATLLGRSVSIDIYCDHPIDMTTVMGFATHGNSVAFDQFLSPRSSSCHSRVRDRGERFEGTVTKIITHVVGTRAREAWVVKVVLAGKNAGRVIYTYLGIDLWETIGRSA